MKAALAILSAAALLLSGTLANADSWDIKKAKRIFRFNDGFRIVAANSASKLPEMPHYSVRILQGRKLLAHYDNLGFEELYASPDERIFLGISNYGFPGTAAVVFDREGKILFEESHDRGISGKTSSWPYYILDYCSHSVTLWRVWFDGENPGVEFGPGNDLASISLRNCRGNRINLVQSVADGEQRARRSVEEFERKQEEFQQKMLELTEQQAKP